MHLHVGFFVSDGRIQAHVTVRQPMVNSLSIPARYQDTRCLAILVRLAFLGPEAEHVALLVNPHTFTSLQRWDNLLDDGVSAVFDLASGEAKLLALSFHAGKFTPARV